MAELEWAAKQANWIAETEQKMEENREKDRAAYRLSDKYEEDMAMALRVWREGVVPLLGLNHLEAFLKGLEEDDHRLIQGATTTPPPLQCVQDWPVEAACGLGYCGWQGEGLALVHEVEEYFARMCFEIDRKMGQPAVCRYFLNWFDDAPREELRLVMIQEVRAAIEIKSRSNNEADSGHLAD